MGKENYNLELIVDLYTKQDDDLDESPSKTVVSDFSSASEETKQILRNQIYVKSEFESS